ncbi:hypothetical protein IWQ62_000173 [Dispira parvispora]|uniref:CENP-T/Histone H4 histone fold domain-containing protein n=1 Tax=Dispira parvispora TaxID=1520584 RepID=A0A9W8E9Y9_9FUNG|nr:hypothetical protein IWQ62_000173 [Dispira parvispora]
MADARSLEPQSAIKRRRKTVNASPNTIAQALAFGPTSIRRPGPPKTDQSLHTPLLTRLRQATTPRRHRPELSGKGDLTVEVGERLTRSGRRTPRAVTPAEHRSGRRKRKGSSENTPVSMGLWSDEELKSLFPESDTQTIRKSIAALETWLPLVRTDQTPYNLLKVLSNINAAHGEKEGGKGESEPVAELSTHTATTPGPLATGGGNIPRTPHTARKITDANLKTLIRSTTRPSAMRTPANRVVTPFAEQTLRTGGPVASSHRRAGVRSRRTLYNLEPTPGDNRGAGSLRLNAIQTPQEMLRLLSRLPSSVSRTPAPRNQYSVANPTPLAKAAVQEPPGEVPSELNMLLAYVNQFITQPSADEGAQLSNDEGTPVHVEQQRRAKHGPRYSEYEVEYPPELKSSLLSSESSGGDGEGALALARKATAETPTTSASSNPLLPLTLPDEARADNSMDQDMEDASFASESVYQLSAYPSVKGTPTNDPLNISELDTPQTQTLLTVTPSLAYTPSTTATPPSIPSIEEHTSAFTSAMPQPSVVDYKKEDTRFQWVFDPKTPYTDLVQPFSPVEMSPTEGDDASFLLELSQGASGVYQASSPLPALPVDETMVGHIDKELHLSPSMVESVDGVPALSMEQLDTVVDFGEEDHHVEFNPGPSQDLSMNSPGYNDLPQVTMPDIDRELLTDGLFTPRQSPDMSPAKVDGGDPMDYSVPYPQTSLKPPLPPSSRIQEYPLGTAAHLLRRGLIHARPLRLSSSAPQHKSRHGTLVPSFSPRLLKDLFKAQQKTSRQKGVSKDVLATLDTITHRFFEQVSGDLAAFADHAGRKVIDQNDVLCLMRRQRQFSQRANLTGLALKHLPRELVNHVVTSSTAAGNTPLSSPNEHS